MRNPFKLFIEFFFLPEEIDTHNIHKVIKHAPRYNYQTKCMLVLIVSLMCACISFFSITCSAVKEVDLLKGKLKHDSIQEQYLQQEQELLKDSV